MAGLIVRTFVHHLKPISIVEAPAELQSAEDNVERQEIAKRILTSQNSLNDAMYEWESISSSMESIDENA